MTPDPTVSIPLRQPALARSLDRDRPRPALVRMRLPFALDHINLWLLDDGETLAVVDVASPATRRATSWDAVLAADGRPVRRVVVTHHHPTTSGSPPWLAARRRGDPHDPGRFFAAQAVWHQLPGYCATDMVASSSPPRLVEPRCATLLLTRGNAYRVGAPQVLRAFPSHVRRRRAASTSAGAAGASSWARPFTRARQPLLRSSGADFRRHVAAAHLHQCQRRRRAAWTTPWLVFTHSLAVLAPAGRHAGAAITGGKPFQGYPGRAWSSAVEHHRERCARLLAGLDMPQKRCSIAADAVSARARYPIRSCSPWGSDRSPQPSPERRESSREASMRTA